MVTGRHLSAAAFLVLALISAPVSRAAEIKIVASNAVKEAFNDLASAFTKISGHHVTSVWGGTVDIIRRVADGEVFDLVIIPASNVDGLIQQGWLQANSRRDFARSAIGVAIASRVATPDLGFTQVSELLTVRGIIYVGPLPQDIQHVTVFSIGLHTAAPAPDAAYSLIEFLTSPAATPAIRHSGMEPG